MSKAAATVAFGVVVALAAGVAAVLAAAPVAGAGAGAKPHSAYPSCGAKGQHADRFCFEGDHAVGVYRAFGRREIAYRFCFRERGERRRCRDRRTHNPGQRSRTGFDIDGSGRYELAWFERGKAVDRDSLVIRERSVFSVGDSLGEGTRPYLPGALPDWEVDQSVSISRHAPEGVSILRGRGSLPGVIVFALGTNDGPGSVSSFSNSIQSVLGIAGATRCVVVPNIVRPPVGGVSYSGYNRVIAAAARHNKNFRAVDWVGLVARNRGWLAGDGVHVDATGYRARARATAKQVEKC